MVSSVIHVDIVFGSWSDQAYAQTGNQSFMFATLVDTNYEFLGYDSESLIEATVSAGTDGSVGSYVYDSIYNCYPNGEIGWSAWCGGPGTCNPAISQVSSAMCKGEPVNIPGSPDNGGDPGDGDGGLVPDPPFNGPPRRFKRW
jgi:hypothetical protein